MRWPGLTERTKDLLATLARFIVIFPMVALGSQVWLFVHGVWTDHWIRKDAQPMPAIVTDVHPKRVLDYRYTVNGKEYTGKDTRRWEEEQSHQLAAGERTTVFVSASHPWLSSFKRSGTAWMAFPIVMLILLFELFLLGVLLDGVLRLVFGIQIHQGQPDDSIVVLMFAGALVLLLALAAFALRRKRAQHFRLFTIRRVRKEENLS